MASRDFTFDLLITNTITSFKQTNFQTIFGEGSSSKSRKFANCGKWNAKISYSCNKTLSVSGAKLPDPNGLTILILKSAVNLFKEMQKMLFLQGKVFSFWDSPQTSDQLWALPLDPAGGTAPDSKIATQIPPYSLPLPGFDFGTGVWIKRWFQIPWGTLTTNLAR